MADIKICDRCRKELTHRRTLLNFRPDRYLLGIVVLTPDLGGLNRTGGPHNFELCDECANELGKFLRYVPVNVEPSITDSITEATDE